jgi:ABC-2 type transport system permease protein
VIRASLRLGASLVLAYRLEVIVMILSAMMVTGLNWSLWTAIFEGRPTVVGRSAIDLTTYVAVAWIVTTFYATRIDEELGRRFRDGLIATDLLRPWSLQAHLYWRELGRSTMSFALATAPLLVLALTTLPLRVPTHAITWLWFLASLVVAQAVAFGIAWHVGLLAFRTGSTTGLVHLKATLGAVLSGALIPLDLYPEPLRTIVTALPFQALSNVPANLFVERAGPASLALPLAWAVVLWATGSLAFGRSRRRLVIQGG